MNKTQTRQKERKTEEERTEKTKEIEYSNS